MPRTSTAPHADQLAFVLDVEPEIEGLAGEEDRDGGERLSSEPEEAAARERTASPQRAAAPEAPPAPDTPEAGPEGSSSPADLSWRAVLDFERGWSGTLAAKQRAIRASFGVSSARYHQQLDRALELPEAVAYDAALVRRLRRVREARRAKRFARRVDTELPAGAGEEGSRGG